jgi:hypothetical protein
VGGVGVRAQGTISATVPTYESGGSGFFTMADVVKSGTYTWGDPVIGARWTPIDAEHWHATLFGDIGAVSGTNRTWELLPSLGFRVTNAFEVQVQYRAFATNYTTDSGAKTFRYDISLLSPQLGFALHF